MPIGRITVPSVAAVGVFPLVTNYPVEVSQDFRVVEHQMDSLAGNLKISQRFLIGTGRPVHVFRRDDLDVTEANALKSFYDTHKGNHVPFTYAAPNADNQTFTNVTAVFGPDPLVISKTSPATFGAELRIIEIPTTFLTYPLTATVLRFPTGTFETALAAQAQELIPLVHIIVKESGHPDNIFLSNRQCTIGAQLYQARLLELPEITQAIDGQSDSSEFLFGNADRVMRDLAFDTDLDGATIEYSLFHVLTSTKLHVWRGRVVGVSGHNQNTFTIEATDPIDLTVQYPYREVSHQCPWVFLGADCAAPITSPECDKTYSGPAGCVAHNNERRFGGHFAQPELVQVKDNSTGLLGKWRRTITPSSIIADTAYGEVLPLHFTDSPMKVNARVISGRDEGGFFIALAIVGQGPVKLSENAMDHKLNGQSAHGPGILGFRASEGHNPAAQGVGIFPADNDHYFQLDETDWPPQSPVFAGGTAFCTIRIKDEEGIQPRSVTEHQVQVTIDRGVEAWYWDAPGTRLSGQGMANPVWVAVHCLLDALGLSGASMSDQEAVVDIDAAIAAAAVNADVVPSLIIGQADETQFKFQGSLGDRRALRDQIADICNSFLGYFTFNFGKLRIGSRINSSAVEAFTSGNIIRDSLRFDWEPAGFNTLTLEYADQLYGWAKNTVTVELAEHVKKYGRRATSMNLPGVASRSQALRIGATRVREECGGIDQSEWKKRLRGTYATTVLGMGVEPGSIISLTHHEMPGAYGEMRVTRWTLSPDLKLTFEWKTTTDSMYDLLVGPKPVDVQPEPLPVERIEENLPVQPWFANRDYAAAGDPIYDPTDGLFAVSQEYELSKDLGGLARIVIEGDHPVTRTVDCDPPRIGGVSLGTGGTIRRGLYVTVVLVATNVDYARSRASRAFGVQMDDNSDTNSIVLEDIEWPPECAGGGFIAYASVDRSLLSGQVFALSAQPSSITIGSIDNIRTTGFPQERLAGLVPRIYRCHHLGINGLPVTEVTSASLKFAEAGWTPGAYANRWVGIFADQSDGSANLWHFLISGNSEDELFLTRDPAAAGVQEGDVASILLQANVADSNMIADVALENPQYPEGLNPADEVGRVVLIAAGRGAGQRRLINAATSTQLFVAPAWDTVPDSSSWFVVISASPDYVGETIRLDVSEEQSSIRATVPIQNLDGATLMVEVGTVASNGRESESASNPRRFIYAFGATGENALPLKEGKALHYLRVTEEEDGVEWAPASASSGGGILLQRVTLSTAALEIPLEFTPAEPGLLVVLVQQSTTAAQDITWAPEFKGASTSITNTLGAWTAFFFTAVGAEWWAVTNPMTELIP